MIARELLIKLGFDIDESKLNRFSQVIDNAKSKMTGLRENVAGKLGSSLKLDRYKFAPMEEYDKSRINDTKGKLTGFSSTTDTKFATLKAYREELASLSKEERDDIISLNKLEKAAINDAKKEDRQRHLEKQRQLKEEQRLEARNRFASWRSGIITASRRVALAGATIMGGFGLALRSTLKDAEDYKQGDNKSGSTFSPKQIAAVDQFNVSLRTTAGVLKEIRNSFVIDMLPAVNEVVISFRKWMTANKDLIQGKLKGAVEVLSGVFKLLLPVISRIVGIFDMLISATIGWKYLITAIIAVGLAVWFAGVAASIWRAVIAFRAFTVAMLSNPITAIITAIIAVLALLVDEIWVTINGGDSLINRFLKSDAWGVCKDYINTVTEALKNMWEWLIKIKDGFLSLPDKTIKWGVELKDNIKDFFDIDKRIKNMSGPAGYIPSGATVRSGHSINQKNSFNMNITVPVGTSQEQAKVITDLVKKELEKHREFETEKTLAAIGAYQ